MGLIDHYHPPWLVHATRRQVHYFDDHLFEIVLHILRYLYCLEPPFGSTYDTSRMMGLIDLYHPPFHFHANRRQVLYFDDHLFEIILHILRYLYCLEPPFRNTCD